MTRTHLKHFRVYADGYDLSGYERSLGAMGSTFEVSPDTAITDEVKNVIIGQPNISIAPINGFLDNDTAGKFNVMKAGNGTRTMMIPIGANAAPSAGNPVFAWRFEQTSYMVEPSNAGFSAANLTLGDASYAGVLTYSKPWGVLVHAKSAETAVNTAIGIDDNGAQTTAGGIFCYQLFSSNGTVTLKMQDASTNTNPSFSDLSGATSGSINASVTPVSGMVALGTTATVRRYLRWQLVFGTATTATFAIAFIRG